MNFPISQVEAILRRDVDAGVACKRYYAADHILNKHLRRCGHEFGALVCMAIG